MAKVGRPMNIKTPEEMWDYFQMYCKDVKSKPFIIKDWVGKDAMQVNREREKPLTMEGFSLWLYDADITANLHHYMANQDNLYEKFRSVCTRIREAIRVDQIGGGMAGVYNASITQRLNGLVDKSETTVVKEQPLFGDEKEE